MSAEEETETTNEEADEMDDQQFRQRAERAFVHCPFLDIKLATQDTDEDEE